MDTEYIRENENLAEELDDDVLEEIGQEIVNGFEEDEDTVSEWRENNDEWIKLAAQVKEKKSYPWPNAANIKFPLLTTAAMQFNSRAYPALVPEKDPIKARPVGYDENGEKQDIAKRIGKHMSYQILEQMDDWEEDMDRLCLILPIIGTVFKKTYYDPLKMKNVSELVLPDDLTVNYYAQSLETAYRKTHKIYQTKNDLLESVNSGLYVECDVENLSHSDHKNGTQDQIQGLKEPAKHDSASPYLILECHTFYDLDDDGYEEPYIISVEYNSKKVLRISRRYDEFNDLTINDKGDIVKIEPTEYFTKFSFVPNPDGGFYDLGFGNLLAPINEVINTTTNQLLDAGTLSNLQSGFIGKGIKLKAGNQRFEPGEWKAVPTTGEDLQKNIYPLPVREPSNVLFQLLEMMIQAGQQLSATTNPMTGENPGQNQKATTTMAVIEQGSKVFHSIYKRLYRALRKEYKKLFRLNGQYLSENEYFTILDTEEENIDTVFRRDYSEFNADVVPAADPTIATEQKKLAKASGLMEMLQLGTINPQEATRRILEAQEHHDIDTLMDVPEQQPDAETQLKMQEQQLEQAKMQDESERKWAEIELKKIEVMAEAMKDMADAEKNENDQTLKAISQFYDVLVKQDDLEIKKLQTRLKEMEIGGKIQQEDNNGGN